MNLGKSVLHELISKNGLVEGVGDLNTQLTANGIDMRLAAVVEVLDGGRLGLSKTDNRNPVLGDAFVLKGYEDRLKEYATASLAVVDKQTIRLKKLTPYLVITCEKVNAPSNLMFHIAARTSVFRLTQSILASTFGEAGYKGYLTFMLVPILDSEIDLGVRFAQLSFSHLNGVGDYADQKETNYQGGKLF